MTAAVIFTSSFINKCLRFYFISVLPTTKYGVHGYDNQEKSMHAIFMAKGPLFAKGKKLKPFNSVDLYNLFCAILDIKCKKNDGNDQMDIWSDLLENTKSSAQGSSNTHKKGKLQYFADATTDYLKSFMNSRK